MRVLVLNAGSSTLRFDIIDSDKANTLYSGNITNFGNDAKLKLISKDTNGIIEQNIRCQNGVEGVGLIIKYIHEASIGYDAIGFRVVHGGSFSSHTLLSPAVLEQLSTYNALAPIDNPVTLEAIKKCSTLTNRPIALIFDTVFFKTLAPLAYTYPVPLKWQEYGVRKYGFHGLNHEYLVRSLGRYGYYEKVITCHLGAASSVSAIMDGSAVDTSMGFTPMSGIMMATRSGDIDPAIDNYIMERLNMSLEEINYQLNYESGIKGLAGVSDIAEVIKLAEAGHKNAMLAIDMFVKKTIEFISSYYVFMGGCDALVFSGGVGENSPIIRQQIIKGLEVLGFKIDDTANASNGSKINVEGTKPAIYVIPANEAMIIAGYTSSLVKNKSNFSNVEILDI